MTPTRGPVPLAGVKDPLFGSSAATAALRTLITEPRTNLLESEYNRVSKRSIEAAEVLNAALASTTPLETAFPNGNSVADQLKMVARMISAAPVIGLKRQVFFVSLAGFDHHEGMLTDHRAKLAQLGAALSAFYAATAELHLADKITTFTASDFGRTLVGNATDGSDHGWGSMHFVLGGAVNGK